MLSWRTKLDDLLILDVLVSTKLSLWNTVVDPISVFVLTLVKLGKI